MLVSVEYEKFLDKMGFYKKEDKTKLKVHREKFKLTAQEIDKEVYKLTCTNSV